MGTQNLGLLASTAMIVDFSAPCWGAKKYDKKISAEVADNYETDETAGRYNKTLRPGGNKRNQNDPPCVKAYDRVRDSVANGRQIHYRLSSPWNNDGGRIILASTYLEYCNEMRAGRRENEEARSEFIPVYPDFKEYYKQTRPKMFREEDWPSETKIAKLFDWKMRTLPIPNAYDFRANISDIEAARIRKEIEEEKNEKLMEAMKDPYTRLFKAVQRMVETLADEDNNGFHNTLVTNLRDVCDLVPKLNFTGDPQLEQFRLEIEKGLTAFDAKDLKEDKSLRKSIEARAREIQSQMSGYIGVAA